MNYLAGISPRLLYFGKWEFRPLRRDELQDFARAVSTITDSKIAGIMSVILEIPVAVGEQGFTTGPGDKVLVFQITGPLPENLGLLSDEQIRQIPHQIGVVECEELDEQETDPERR